MQDPPHRLEEACACMRWVEEPGRFALVGFRGDPAPEDLALFAGAAPASLVREAGRTTLLVPRERAAAVRSRHAQQDARMEDGRVWIRFEAPMAWDLVGFLALVSGRLAAAGVPLGVVCSFDRDHLFVAEEHLERTRAVLTELFGPSAEGRPRRSAR